MNMDHQNYFKPSRDIQNLMTEKLAIAQDRCTNVKSMTEMQYIF